MRGAFYNEIDPFAANWLEALIAAGSICSGVVDRRDVRDIAPRDLDGFEQVHFFAGLGGWSYALRLAGWPDDRPVWTGSCPCQPFSAAGRGGGLANADGGHAGAEREQRSGEQRQQSQDGVAGLVGDATGERCGKARSTKADTGRSEMLACTSHWHDLEWLPCRDGKARPTQRRLQSVDDGLWPSMVDSGANHLSPLATGQKNRVGMLRGAGNAIVPQVAAAFISSFLETDDHHA